MTNDYAESTAPDSPFAMILVWLSTGLDWRRPDHRERYRDHWAPALLDRTEPASDRGLTRHSGERSSRAHLTLRGHLCPRPAIRSRYVRPRLLGAWQAMRTDQANLRAHHDRGTRAAGLRRPNLAAMRQLAPRAALS